MATRANKKSITGKHRGARNQGRREWNIRKKEHVHAHLSQEDRGEQVTQDRHERYSMPPSKLCVCSCSTPCEVGLFLETNKTFHRQEVTVNYLHVPPTPWETCVRTWDWLLNQSCPGVGLSVKNWGWEETMNKLLQSPKENSSFD